MQNFKIHEIESIGGLLSEVDQSTADQMIVDFREAQPYLLAYLVAASEIFEDSDDADTIFLLGVLIWMLYKSKKEALPAISEEIINQTESDLLGELDKIDLIKDKKKFEKAVSSWQKNQPQQELFNFILAETQELMSEQNGAAITILLVAILAFEKVS